MSKGTVRQADQHAVAFPHLHIAGNVQLYKSSDCEKNCGYVKELEKGIIRLGISVGITSVKLIVYSTGTFLALCLTAV
jgi:hypothetical protein